MFSKHPSLQDLEDRDPARLAYADPSVPLRACCCPAQPAVKVIVPPGPRRDHPVDLWLCGHHYRASVATLATASAICEDIAYTGSSTPDDHATIPAARRGGDIGP